MRGAGGRSRPGQPRRGLSPARPPLELPMRGDGGGAGGSPPTCSGSSGHLFRPGAEMARRAPPAHLLQGAAAGCGVRARGREAGGWPHGERWALRARRPWGVCSRLSRPLRVRARPPPAAPFNRAPPRLCPDASRAGCARRARGDGSPPAAGRGARDAGRAFASPPGGCGCGAHPSPSSLGVAVGSRQSLCSGAEAARLGTGETAWPAGAAARSPQPGVRPSWTSRHQCGGRLCWCQDTSSFFWTPPPSYSPPGAGARASLSSLEAQTVGRY